MYFLLLLAQLAFAAEVSPLNTDATIRQVKGPHQYFVPARFNGKTLITIGGTGSHPAELKNIQLWALAQGYRVLGVDYENEVISTLCWKSSNLDCYDNYRAEIVFGRPLSTLTNVNPSNSIANRIDKLVNYLKWKVNWSDVVLMGHSQGAGHVAYIAKIFGVHRVIMTGGPHDYYSGIGPAAWTLNPSATAPTRFFTFIHKNDFFGIETPLGSSKALMGETVVMDNISTEVSSDTHSQIFMTEVPMPDPHNSYANPAFKKVWDYLLRP